MPRMQIPEKMLPLLKPKRYKICLGGRGSGKSMSMADLCLVAAQTQGIKTLCAREYQNSIDDSVHALLSSEIERLDLQGFSIQRSEILFDGETAFKYIGLARSPESVKSYHNFSRVFVEEAQTISESSLKALTPTLREAGSEIWMAANPRSSADAFSQRFIKPFEKELRRDKIYEDDLHTIVWVNYSDNPAFPEVLEQERAYDEKNMSAALYAHVWEGETYDEHEDSIIPVEWYLSAVDSHIKLGWKPEGSVIAAHDPSDEGGDSKAYCLRHGNVILDVCELVTGDAAEGMDWALDKAIQDRADHFVFDADGLGVSLKRQVDQALTGKVGMKYTLFKGSEAAQDPELPYTTGGMERNKTNRETFRNKRAQFYWKLRDRFEATHRAVTKGEYVNPEEMISLSSSISCLDQLRAEVCRIPLKRNNLGKIQILSKVEMAKAPYRLPSPNMGDALMMSMISPKVNTQEKVVLNFSGWK
jgi:phage terminase large subunit|tara:strand:- start:537 stop:1958 length:1422 start_codon:yes stop_codon:yes gene_type:complete